MKNEIIKEKVKERYGKIALVGNSDSCCMPYFFRMLQCIKVDSILILL